MATTNRINGGAAETPALFSGTDRSLLDQLLSVWKCTMCKTMNHEVFARCGCCHRERTKLWTCQVCHFSRNKVLQRDESGNEMCQKCPNPPQPSANWTCSYSDCRYQGRNLDGIMAYCGGCFRSRTINIGLLDQFWECQNPECYSPLNVVGLSRCLGCGLPRHDADHERVQVGLGVPFDYEWYQRLRKEIGNKGYHFGLIPDEGPLVPAAIDLKSTLGRRAFYLDIQERMARHPGMDPILLQKELWEVLPAIHIYDVVPEFLPIIFKTISGHVKKLRGDRLPDDSVFAYSPNGPEYKFERRKIQKAWKGLPIAETQIVCTSKQLLSSRSLSAINPKSKNLCHWRRTWGENNLERGAFWRMKFGNSARPTDIIEATNKPAKPPSQFKSPRSCEFRELIELLALLKKRESPPSRSCVEPKKRPVFGNGKSISGSTIHRKGTAHTSAQNEIGNNGHTNHKRHNSTNKTLKAATQHNMQMPSKNPTEPQSRGAPPKNVPPTTRRNTATALKSTEQQNATTALTPTDQRNAATASTSTDQRNAATASTPTEQRTTTTASTQAARRNDTAASKNTMTDALPRVAADGHNRRETHDSPRLVSDKDGSNRRDTHAFPSSPANVSVPNPDPTPASATTVSLDDAMHVIMLKVSLDTMPSSKKRTYDDMVLHLGQDANVATEIPALEQLVAFKIIPPPCGNDSSTGDETTSPSVAGPVESPVLAQLKSPTTANPSLGSNAVLPVTQHNTTNTNSTRHSTRMSSLKKPPAAPAMPLPTKDNATDKKGSQADMAVSGKRTTANDGNCYSLGDNSGTILERDAASRTTTDEGATQQQDLDSEEPRPMEVVSSASLPQPRRLGIIKTVSKLTMPSSEATCKRKRVKLEAGSRRITRVTTVSQYKIPLSMVPANQEILPSNEAAGNSNDDGSTELEEAESKEELPLEDFQQVKGVKPAFEEVSQPLDALLDDNKKSAKSISKATGNPRYIITQDEGSAPTLVAPGSSLVGDTVAPAAEGETVVAANNMASAAPPAPLADRGNASLDLDLEEPTPMEVVPSASLQQPRRLGIIKTVSKQKTTPEIIDPSSAYHPVAAAAHATIGPTWPPTGTAEVTATNKQVATKSVVATSEKPTSINNHANRNMATDSDHVIDKQLKKTRANKSGACKSTDSPPAKATIEAEVTIEDAMGILPNTNPVVGEPHGASAPPISTLPMDPVNTTIAIPAEDNGDTLPPISGEIQPVGSEEKKKQPATPKPRRKRMLAALDDFNGVSKTSKGALASSRKRKLC